MWEIKNPTDEVGFDLNLVRLFRISGCWNHGSNWI